MKWNSDELYQPTPEARRTAFVDTKEKQTKIIEVEISLRLTLVLIIGHEKMSNCEEMKVYLFISEEFLLLVDELSKLIFIINWLYSFELRSSWENYGIYCRKYRISGLKVWSHLLSMCFSVTQQLQDFHKHDCYKRKLKSLNSTHPRINPSW